MPSIFVGGRIRGCKLMKCHLPVREETAIYVTRAITPGRRAIGWIVFHCCGSCDGRFVLFNGAPTLENTQFVSIGYWAPGCAANSGRRKPIENRICFLNARQNRIRTFDVTEICQLNDLIHRNPVLGICKNVGHLI